MVRRRDTPQLEVHDLLAMLDSDHRLLLHLKGVHPRLAGRLAAVLRQVVPDTVVTVCTQHWWMLDAFRDLAHVRLLRSAGSRLWVDGLIGKNLRVFS